MKNRKLLSLALAAALSMSVLAGCSGGDGNGTATAPGGTGIPGTTSPVDSQLKMTSGEWNNIEWTTYSHQYVTCEIPKGWTVEVTDLYQGGQTGSGTMILVKNPDSTVSVSYMDFCTILSTYMKDTTVTSFFRDAVAANAQDVSDWTPTSTYQTESQKAFAQANSSVYDAGVVTADWKSSKGNMEGIYSACVESSLGMYGMYTIVSPISMDVPKGTMANWEGVLTKIMGSVQWTQVCMQRYSTSVLNSPSSGSNESNPIMEAWDNRNKSEDIMSQKRSDATMGSERVYDTTTGDIYMANNGFYEQYSTQGGQRYQPITDDMYTQGYVGYLSF